MPNAMRQGGRIAATVSLLVLGSIASVPPVLSASGSGRCPDCIKPHKPFRIFGNTYFVGTEGLSSILVTSEFGHVLIDAGGAAAAPLIKANIEALGFKLTDIKGILVSAESADVAGGVAQLQRESGAPVYATRPAEAVLRTGKPGVDDPLAAARESVAPVPVIWIVHDDQLLGFGSVRLRATATPGSSPGGTSWSWESCESGSCLNFFYAGSLAANAAGKYRYKDHPEMQEAFEESFKRVEAAACDVLLTSHPAASQLFQRLDPQGGTRAASIKDDAGCKRLAQSAREAFSRYLAAEK